MMDSRLTMWSFQSTSASLPTLTAATMFGYCFAKRIALSIYCWFLILSASRVSWGIGVLSQGQCGLLISAESHAPSITFNLILWSWIKRNVAAEFAWES